MDFIGLKNQNFILQVDYFENILNLKRNSYVIYLHINLFCTKNYIFILLYLKKSLYSYK